MYMRAVLGLPRGRRGGRELWNGTEARLESEGETAIDYLVYA